MPDSYLPPPNARRRSSLLFFVVLAFVLLLFSRYFASTFIDYVWWNEVGQKDTWFSLFLYRSAPTILVTLLFWAVFFLAIRRAFTSTIRSSWQRPHLVLRLVYLFLPLLALIAASVTVDSWTAVRFAAGQALAPNPAEFVDPIFHRPLHFYFFSLPFYKMLLHVVMAGVLLSLALYWLASNAENLFRRFELNRGGTIGYNWDPSEMNVFFASAFVRYAGAALLLGYAGSCFFGRYDYLFEDHGSFLVGVDWIADHVILPLQWLTIVGAVAAAVLLVSGQGRTALLLLLILPVRYLLPAAISGLYVHPNELALERPYIQRHIDATRAAYGLNRRVKESGFEAVPATPIGADSYKPTLENVRLWDWRAFHDTVSQIQPLRPYVYYDTDVDRYTIDGQLRQVLISPRELDIRQLGTSANWINSHLIYTHGYGLVLAEANHITPDGLPELFIKNAPPEVSTASLSLKAPEIYYSELAQDPVYVSTRQQEFNYPAGAESKYTTYAGSGGFPIDPFATRLAAALTYGDTNLLLTSYLRDSSRMLIHRRVLDRLNTLAGFLTWDADPYLVLDKSGHPIWMVDGYMTSDAHPYSRTSETGTSDFNYIRNSVKATVDAYSGAVNIYLFDTSDVLINAYARLFPQLFKPLSAMPADIRAHARYPELLFSTQAEIYRTFHMRDPEAFYNRADLWDLARSGNKGSDNGTAGSVTPTYVVAALPGEAKAEFMLITVFTPANKDNLIGFMAARCDGENLGELRFVELSKQNIIFGPMQIDARINQDSTISKDLTLWNQQGSQVLRGQTLVLPIANSFLYVEPIYIQASQASMPQLKKVALAMGNVLAYADTYDEALTQLVAALEQVKQSGPTTKITAVAPSANNGLAATTAVPGGSNSEALRTLSGIRDHLARYRDLSSQGKWAEAGKELEAIQNLAAGK